jgi:hypothetical protein
MKKIILAAFLLCQLAVYAQTDSVPERLYMHETVKVFIKGRLYQNTIEKDFFNTDFDLAASDTTFKIVRYLATWDDTLGKLHAMPVDGAQMAANIPGHSLGALGNVIAFERIIIMDTKKREFFAAPTLVITPSDVVTADKSREGLAFCDAFIKGYKNQVNLVYSVFSTDQFVELTDTSYHLLGFDLELEDEQEGEIVKTHIKGNRIPVEKDDVTRLLKRLRTGDSFIIKNIKAEKDGEEYNVKDLTIYIK